MAQTNETRIKGAESTAGSESKGEKANIAPATEFAPSGAPVQTSGDIDPANLAVDADPRAGTTVDQNRIDFNDPRPGKGAEAVANNLNAQGVPTKVVDEAAEPARSKAEK